MDARKHIIIVITPKTYRALLCVNKSVNFCTREHPNRKRLSFKWIGSMRSRDGIKYLDIWLTSIRNSYLFKYTDSILTWYSRSRTVNVSCYESSDKVGTLVRIWVNLNFCTLLLLLLCEHVDLVDSKKET